MIRDDELPIRRPCRMVYSQMTDAGDAGRHCDSCNKVVHDLALLTENEGRWLLRDAESRNELCIRYVADGRGELLLLPPIPTASLTRKKRAALASAALAAALATSGCAEALGGSPGLVTIRVSRRYVDSARSYELVRADVRVSVVDVRGIGTGTGRTLSNDFLQGHCEGGDVDCDAVQTMLRRSSSTPEFLDNLQRDGFMLVTVRTGPAMVY